MDTDRGHFIFVYLVCQSSQSRATCIQSATVNHVHLAGTLLVLFWYEQKSPKYEYAKKSFELGYTIRNKWTYIHSVMMSVSLNQLESVFTFRKRKKKRLQEAII